MLQIITPIRKHTASVLALSLQTGAVPLQEKYKNAIHLLEEVQLVLIVCQSLRCEADDFLAAAIPLCALSERLQSGRKECWHDAAKVWHRR